MIALVGSSEPEPSDAKHRLRTTHGVGGIHPSSGLVGRAGRRKVVDPMGTTMIRPTSPV